MTSRNHIISQSFVQIQRLTKKIQKLEKLHALVGAKLQRFQSLRLAVGLVFFAGVFILTLNPQWNLELLWVLSFIILFTGLVISTRKIQSHLTRLARLKDFYHRQRLRCEGKASGRKFEVPANNLAKNKDLGLLGPHSLWTLIDESLTDAGQKKLLEWMFQASVSLQNIQKRQEKIRALRPLKWFYTRLILEVDPKSFQISSSQIENFLQSSFVKKNFFAATYLTWALWIVAILGLLFLTPPIPASVFVIVFGVVNFMALSNVAGVFHNAVGLEAHLTNLSPIFSTLEKRLQSDLYLRSLCPNCFNTSPAKSSRQLQFQLGFLGVQTNPILYLLLNFFTPWSITATFFIERKRRELSEQFPKCLNEFAELEALASLMLLDRYQTNSYPQWNSDQKISFKGLFHPLLDREKVVDNSFEFPPAKSLGLLTGSNMAGKSTFLRTLGMNQVLANMGAPVFAESFITQPYNIETCIEVSDSLRDGYSYFYAEVRRLKDILDEADKNEPLLFLIDEIFRGTNNRERHIGSRGLIESLARRPQATGFISTHDLELANLEASVASIINLHFREEISPEGKMSFSYQLHPGPCPTTNALRIMKAEGIPLPEGM